MASGCAGTDASAAIGAWERERKRDEITPRLSGWDLDRSKESSHSRSKDSSHMENSYWRVEKPSK